VAQRALEEIEKATGFKAILLVGGLTPASNGTISTHLYVPFPFPSPHEDSRTNSYTSGQAAATGLSFAESWSGCSELRQTFGEWLQMVYSKCCMFFDSMTLIPSIANEEKSRREGYSMRSLTPMSDGLVPDELPMRCSQTRTNSPTLTVLNEQTPTTPDEAHARNVPPTPPQTSNLPSPEKTPTETTQNSELAPSPADESGRASPPMHPSPSVTPATLTLPQVTRDETSAISRSVSPPPTPEARLFEHNPSHPNFITPATIDYLNSVEGGPHWVDMVRNYLRLESQYNSRVSSYPPLPLTSSNKCLFSMLGDYPYRSVLERSPHGDTNATPCL
jgi:hypothetical protein